MGYLVKANTLARLLLVAALGGGFVVTSIGWPTVAEARVGGGRSIGRSPSAPMRRSSPPPSSPSYDYRSPGANPYSNPYQPRPTPPVEARSGGFLRNMAGGVAGGFLGSMLFNSFGRGGGGGGYGPGGYGSGGGGGIGLLDLLLIGGLGFLAFRWWRSRQVLSSTPSYDDNVVNFRMPQEDHPIQIAAATLDAEEATDLFFRIQGAWTRRDLSAVRTLLSDEMTAQLDRDLQDLKTQHRVNRLENISVRHVDVGPAWSEGGMTLVTVRFTANLLDYTVDESSSKVLEGSDSTPVKFVEDWTFGQLTGKRDWQLVGIAQV